MPLGMFFGWTLLGCPAPEPEPKPVEAPVEAPPLPAPSPAQTPQLPQLDGVTLPPMGDVMSEHFVDVLTLALGVMGGDLKAAQQAASRISNLQPEPGLPASAASYYEQIHAAGRQAEAASSLPEAAAATASAMLACGQCHTATGGGPKDAMPEPPAGPHMGRHVFGAYWMAYGLFAPNDAAWVGGAKALSDARLLPEDWKPVPGQEQQDQAVHEAARKAAALTEPQARATALGEVMATCAPCHQKIPH